MKTKTLSSIIIMVILSLVATTNVFSKQLKGETFGQYFYNPYDEIYENKEFTQNDHVSIDMDFEWNASISDGKPKFTLIMEWEPSQSDGFVYISNGDIRIPSHKIPVRLLNNVSVYDVYPVFKVKPYNVFLKLDYDLMTNSNSRMESSTILDWNKCFFKDKTLTTPVSSDMAKDIFQKGFTLGYSHLHKVSFYGTGEIEFWYKKEDTPVKKEVFNKPTIELPFGLKFGMNIDEVKSLGFDLNIMPLSDFAVFGLFGDEDMGDEEMEEKIDGCIGVVKNTNKTIEGINIDKIGFYFSKSKHDGYSLYNIDIDYNPYDNDNDSVLNKLISKYGNPDDHHAKYEAYWISKDGKFFIKFGIGTISYTLKKS